MDLFSFLLLFVRCLLSGISDCVITTITLTFMPRCCVVLFLHFRGYLHYVCPIHPSIHIDQIQWMNG